MKFFEFQASIYCCAGEIEDILYNITDQMLQLGLRNFKILVYSFKKSNKIYKYVMHVYHRGTC